MCLTRGRIFLVSHFLGWGGVAGGCQGGVGDGGGVGEGGGRVDGDGGDVGDVGDVGVGRVDQGGLDDVLCVLLFGAN